MRACDETYLEWAPAGWRAPELAPARTVRLNAPGRWSHVLLDRGGGLVALVSFRPGFEAESPGAPAGDPLPGVAHLGTLLVHPKVL
jgi:hypothetical protein